MMSMKAWAEREVEIACKRENTDRKEGEWDYGCACYESALKAFNISYRDDNGKPEDFDWYGIESLELN